MDRNTPLMIDLALMSHKELVRDAERRQAILEVTNRRSRSRLFGIRRAVGHSLIAAGERIRIDECDLLGEDLAGEPLSLTLSR